MAVEVITITPTEQSIDAVLAFAKGLMTRGISAGATKEDGKVKIFMLPVTAARYEKGTPTFLEDRDAVMAAIKAAGFKIQDGLGAATDTNETPPTPVQAPVAAAVPAPKPAKKA